MRVMGVSEDSGGKSVMDGEWLKSVWVTRVGADSSGLFFDETNWNQAMDEPALSDHCCCALYMASYPPLRLGTK